MHIERANHEDREVIENLQALEDALFPDNAFGEGTLRQELAIGYCAVLKDGMDIVVGYALVRPNQELHDLLRLGVMPGFQNRGYGSWLLAHTLERFPGPMMLTVLKSNAIARRLYEKNGFRIVAAADNAWLMRKPTSSGT